MTRVVFASTDPNSSDIRAVEVDMSTDLGTLELPAPVLTASGALLPARNLISSLTSLNSGPS